MKKAILNVKINVPDSYSCGDCTNCPLHEEKYIDDRSITFTYSCKLGYNKTTCPVEVEEN